MAPSSVAAVRNWPAARSASATNGGVPPLTLAERAIAHGGVVGARCALGAAHDLFITAGAQDEPFVMSTMREYEVDGTGHRAYQYRVIIWVKTVHGRLGVTLGRCVRWRALTTAGPNTRARRSRRACGRQGKEQHVLKVVGENVLTAGQVLQAVAPTLATKKVGGACLLRASGFWPMSPGRARLTVAWRTERHATARRAGSPSCGTLSASRPSLRRWPSNCW